MGFLECVIRLLIGRMIINSCLKEKKKQHTLLPCFFESDSDDDTWRLYCEDGAKYDLDPEDYDTEEEYEEALEEAKLSSITGETNITITITVSFEMPGMEALNAIKPADYPNERQYDAAYHLCAIE